jgi:hypothetical protein
MNNQEENDGSGDGDEDEDEDDDEEKEEDSNEELIQQEERNEAILEAMLHRICIIS